MAGASPRIDYLARDYESVRQLLLDRLAAAAPDWRERHAADLGVTLVEALAYAADQLSYHQDAVATEAYLGTARQRVSVRRHARLLDHALDEGRNARVLVAVEVGLAGALPRVDAATGIRTRFWTRLPGVEETLPVREPDAGALAHAEAFEPLEDAFLAPAHNLLRVHSWSAAPFALAAGATGATFVDDEAQRLSLMPGDVVALQPRAPSGDSAATTGPAVRLTRVLPAARPLPGGQRAPGPLRRDPLTGTPIVDVAWDAADALPAALPIVGADPRDPPLAFGVGNLVLADHGLTVQDALRVPDDNAPLRLPRGPVAHAPAPQVRLRIAGEAWDAAPDLVGAGPFHRAFVLETDGAGVAWARFGDGTCGRRPASGAAVEATYRLGGGPRGNVAAGTVVHLACAAELDVARVHNPLPARGGTPPQAVEAARLLAPAAARENLRAVTAADHAALARRHPEVADARADAARDGSGPALVVTVARHGAAPADRAFLRRVSAFLEPRRLLGRVIEVAPARRVAVDLALAVRLERGASWPHVRQALARTFSDALLPDGEPGFFHESRFPLGRTLPLSAVVERALRVPGARAVEAERFGVVGSPAAQPAAELDPGPRGVLRLHGDPRDDRGGCLAFRRVEDA